MTERPRGTLLGAAVVMVPVADLENHPDNPRTGDIKGIAESIKSNGWWGVLVAQKSTGYVIVGNHRLRAARLLKMKELPVQYVDVSDPVARRILLADNRYSDLATYDEAALEKLLEAVLSSQASLEGTGYTPNDLDQLIASRGSRKLEATDDPPARPETPVTKPGDRVVLGEHVLVCGDASKEETWRRLLGADEKLDAVWTDPPYNVAYVGKTKAALKIKNDALSSTEIRTLLGESLGLAARFSKKGAPWYVAAPHGPQFLPFALVLSGLQIWRQTIVWLKDVFVMGRSDYHYKHEVIFEGAVPDAPLGDSEYDSLIYGWTEGGSHPWFGDRRQTTIWEVARPKASREHPTMKPVELVRRALALSTQLGDVVCDPFSGSGTTLVVCEEMRRRARCIEIDPAYVDVIVSRWETMTGRRAVRSAA